MRWSLPVGLVALAFVCLPTVLPGSADSALQPDRELSFNSRLRGAAVRAMMAKSKAKLARKVHEISEAVSSQQEATFSQTSGDKQTPRFRSVTEIGMATDQQTRARLLTNAEITEISNAAWTHLQSHSPAQWASVFVRCSDGQIYGSGKWYDAVNGHSEAQADANHEFTQAFVDGVCDANAGMGETATEVALWTTNSPCVCLHFKKATQLCNNAVAGAPDGCGQTVIVPAVATFSGLKNPIPFQVIFQRPWTHQGNLKWAGHARGEAFYTGNVALTVSAGKNLFRMYQSNIAPDGTVNNIKIM